MRLPELRPENLLSPEKLVDPACEAEWWDREKGLLTFLPDTIPEQRKKSLSEVYKRFGWMWWSTHPYLSTFRCDTDSPQTLATEEMKSRAIMGCTLLRRGKNSIVRFPDHPDGTAWKVKVGDKMKSVMIRTDEVGHGVKYKIDEQLIRLCDTHITGLVEQGDTDGESDHLRQVRQRQKHDDVDASATTVHIRPLHAASVNWAIENAFRTADDISSMSAADLDQAENILRRLVDNDDADRRLPERTRGTKEEPIAFGAEHSRRIACLEDGGLAYVNVLANAGNYKYFRPSARRDRIREDITDSPIMARTLEIVLDNKLNDKRVLVVTTDPLIHQ